MFYLIIIGLGLIFGSFAGAVASRYGTGKSITIDRSRCDNCGHVLDWKDLLPLISWFSLKGHCRYCGTSISIFNPLIELTTSGLFIVSVLNWDFSQPFSELILGLWLAIVVCMVIIAAYDIRHFQVPMLVAYTMLALGGVMFTLNSIASQQTVPEALLQLLIQLTAAVVLIVLPWAISRGKWMGSGDIYLAALSGLVMSSVTASFMGVLLGFYVGAIVTLPLLLSKRLKRHSKIPFGPFILSGVYILYVWQQPLTELIYRGFSL